MSRNTIVALVENIAERAASAQQIEVVEVELKGTGRNHLLRVFIDKPEGVTHADCERMSQAMGETLDAEDVLPGHYTLEVSSPGVERKLKKPGDFERFQGQKARLVMLDADLRPGSPKSRFVEGTLAGVENEGVLLDTPSGERLHIPFAVIDRANLKFEW